MRDPSQLRRRLNEILRTDADLNAFCLEFFPNVYGRFANGMDRLQKVTLLLAQVPDPDRILANLEQYKAGEGSPQVPTATAPGAPPPSVLDWRNPFSVLRAAITAVPVMKYALGVAGLAAVVAMVTRGFGLDAGTATVGSLLVLVLMTVLIVLAVAARQSQQLARQSIVLTWAFVGMTLCASALLLASLFFQWPRPLRCLVHEELCAQERSIEPKRLEPAPPLPPALIDLPIESIPRGARVWSVDNALLCEKTPCNLKVPAHAPLELRFNYPGREYTFKTNDPFLNLQRGGVRVSIPPSKVAR